jgi:D,D-heptose 1,7-bisphosphate phosphatase
MSARYPAVFLDKDGTLVDDVPYNVDPEQVRLAAGAGEALRQLQAAGYRLVVVSNQSGVARGYFDEASVLRIFAHLARLLECERVRLDGFYFCPHHPEGQVEAYSIDCICRKPAPGLLRRAAQDLRLDLEASWMIGDILNDVEAAKRAGCRAVLINNGNETEWICSPLRIPDRVAKNLLEAAVLVQAAEMRVFTPRG